MKRIISICCSLCLVLLLVVGTVPAQAEGSADTLTVETRSGSYTFKVGETFTYSYWLRLSPDIVNYSEDFLVDYIAAAAKENGIELPSAALDNIDIGTLTKMELKSAGGNIKYDTEHLTLVSSEMPNTKKGYTLQKNDLLAGSLIDSGVLDFTNSDLGFWTGKVNRDADKKVFQETNILVSCKFKVTEGSDEPVYLRTRLRHLEVTTNGFLGLTDSTDIVLVHRDQSVFIPYESYETINDEQPVHVLKSLVDDVGLDIRYFNTSGDKDDYSRPGAGVTVNMYGFSTDGRYQKLNTKTTGDKVTWFYDVPYGQYYVNCSFKNENGNMYATPDPEKAEHINVPATGEVQALWLIKSDPSVNQQINLYISWEGDEGYLPARPDYLIAELKTGAEDNVLHKRLIERDQSYESFDCVDIYDADGNRINYDLKISAVIGADEIVSGNGAFPYKVNIEKLERDDGGADFFVKLSYQGDGDALWKIQPDENGHYWAEDGTISIAASCTAEGRVYYVCKLCHATKYEVVPAKGHSWDSGTVLRQPTESSYGVKQYSCLYCSETRYEDIPPLSHSHAYTASVTAPTCTEKGYTTHSCTCGDSYVDSYTDALGHDTELRNVSAASCTEAGCTGDEVCKRCGETVKQGSTINALGHDYANGVCTRCGEAEVKPLVNPFVDVSESNYYYDAVLWAYYHEPQISGGKDAAHFCPMDICTRAQIVTFLWRANGCPEPAGDEKSFTDVNEGAYYYKAVTWAAEQGITSGFNDGSFHPDELVTRAQAMTFLWRAEGRPSVPLGTISTFRDVLPGSYYYNAVRWAVANDITGGYNAAQFGSMDGCTRAQIVSFLYRYMVRE